MNLHVLSQLDSIVEQTMCNFSKFYMVKSALNLDEDHQIAQQIKIISDFYLKFLHDISFIPAHIKFLRRTVVGFYDLKEDIDHSDPMIAHAIAYLGRFQLTENCVAVPVHARYGNSSDMMLCTGLGWMEDRSKILLILIELAFPKDKTSSVRENLSYVSDILKKYEFGSQKPLREFLKSEGYNYNQFQRDCRIYLGDTFYRYILKLKMIDALQDIVFTDLSFKEVAFKNKFADYTNMYKTFRNFKVHLTDIPRLKKL